MGTALGIATRGLGGGSSALGIATRGLYSAELLSLPGTANLEAFVSGAMTDARFVVDLTEGFSDLEVSEIGDLAIERELSTSVLLSLFSDRRAESDDEIAPGSSRRGWWGDAFEDGDAWGSRLWTLRRSKITGDTLNQVRERALESLQWFLEDGVASKVEVEVSRPRRDLVELVVILRAPASDSPLAFRFRFLWSEIT